MWWDDGQIAPLCRQISLKGEEEEGDFDWHEKIQKSKDG